MDLGIFKKLGLLILLVLATAKLYSSTPMWTYEPSAEYPPHITLTQGESALIKYKVTNKSHKNHLLRMLPIKGIVASGCVSSLSFQQSCILTLQIQANALTQSISGGPIMCINGNLNQCYQPSRENVLNIQIVKRPITSPTAPRNVNASPGDTLATIQWDPPASNGGSPITGYIVNSTPGNKTCVTTGATSCVVTGLTNGTSYTFTVTARNVVGLGPPSMPSNAITPSPTMLIITPISGLNGTITPNTPQSVALGGSILFTASPNLGYEISGWALDGAPYPACSTNTTCQLTNITTNHTLAVSFAQQSFIVTPTAGANGSIAPNSAQTVLYGANVSFTATPDVGYEVNSWLVDGSPYPSCGTNALCSLNNVTANHVIHVNFSVVVNPVTVVPSAGPNGNIAPNTPQTISSGNSLSFTATPSTGYAINEWSLDGSPYAPCSTNTTCQLTNVTTNHTLAVSFILQSYTVTASGDAQVTPAPLSQSVDYNNTAVINLTVDPGYTPGIASNTCGGALVGTIFTSGPITSACAVSFNSTLNSYTVTASGDAQVTPAPLSQSVDYNNTAVINLTVDPGYTPGIASNTCGEPW